MNGFFYHRVSVEGLRQFATLAINSNENHPAHQRKFQQGQINSNSNINNFLNNEEIINQISSLISINTLLPLPLISLILDYCQIRSLFSGESHGLIKEWEINDSSDNNNFKIINKFHSNHKHYLSALVINHDKTIITGSFDSTIVIHKNNNLNNDKDNSDNTNVINDNSDNNDNKQIFRLGHEISALHYHIMNETLPVLLVGSSQLTLDIYNFHSLRLIESLSGHTSRITVIIDHFIDNNKKIVTASWDGDCRIWDMKLLKCEILLKGRGKSLTCLTFLTKDIIIAGDVEGKIWIWFLNNNNNNNININNSNNGEKDNTIIDNDKMNVEVASSSIASITLNQTRHSTPLLFNTSSTSSTPTISSSMQPLIISSTAAFKTNSSNSAVRALLPLSFNFNDDFGFVSGGDEGLIRIWRQSRNYQLNHFHDWQCLQALKQNISDGQIYSLASLSSYRIAVGHGGKIINIWDLYSIINDDNNSNNEALPVFVSSLTGAEKSVRCLSVWQSIDIGQFDHS